MNVCVFSLQRISELEAQLEEVSKAEAVHQYKETHFRKREDSLQEEVVTLKQRLENANEGRDYEKEVFLSKVEALKKAEEVSAKPGNFRAHLLGFCKSKLIEIEHVIFVCARISDLWWQ